MTPKVSLSIFANLYLLIRLNQDLTNSIILRFRFLIITSLKIHDLVLRQYFPLFSIIHCCEPITHHCELIETFISLDYVFTLIL